MSFDPDWKVISMVLLSLHFYQSKMSFQHNNTFAMGRSEPTVIVAIRNSQTLMTTLPTENKSLVYLQQNELLLLFMR